MTAQMDMALLQEVQEGGPAEQQDHSALGCAPGAGMEAAAAAASGAQDYDDDPLAAALEGCFILDGVPVDLPVRRGDSLALKVRLSSIGMATAAQLGTVDRHMLLLWSSDAVSGCYGRTFMMVWVAQQLYSSHVSFCPQCSHPPMHHGVSHGNATGERLASVTNKAAAIVHPQVEALRMYLEQQLGTSAFLAAYRKLEELQPDEDEAEATRAFHVLLGDKMAHLQLIHQLIVCEENMHSSTL